MISLLMCAPASVSRVLGPGLVVGLGQVQGLGAGLVFSLGLV